MSPSDFIISFVLWVSCLSTVRRHFSSLLFHRLHPRGPILFTFHNWFHGSDGPRCGQLRGHLPPFCVRIVAAQPRRQPLSREPLVLRVGVVQHLGPAAARQDTCTRARASSAGGRPGFSDTARGLLPSPWLYPPHVGCSVRSWSTQEVVSGTPARAPGERSS